MKFKWHLISVTVLLMAALGGCDSESVISYKPGSKPLTAVQIQAARDLLSHSLVRDSKGRPVGYYGGDVSIKNVAAVDVTTTALSITLANDQHTLYRYPFASLGEIRIASDPLGWYIEVMGKGMFHFRRDSEDTVRRIATAMVTLEHAAKYPLAPNQDPEFQKVVARYHASSGKLAIPETVRMYEVQAEDAIKHERFRDAADLYESALEVAPWWPEGHYNRALILGQIKDYAHAVVEMERYLALVPHASNARAVQDQIYVWEHRENVAKSE